MTKLEGVAEGWASYEDGVLPASAGHIQRKETRRAFYAGVEWMLDQMSDIGSDDVSEDAGVKHLEKISAEIMAFVKDVGAGRA